MITYNTNLLRNNSLSLRARNAWTLQRLASQIHARCLMKQKALGFGSTPWLLAIRKIAIPRTDITILLKCHTH